MKLARINHFPAFVAADVFNRHFINDFLGSDAQTLTHPSVNITESDADFKVYVAAPGLVKENFSINIEKKNLTISAKKEQKEAKEGENVAPKIRYTRQEFNYGSFSRTFQLTENIDVAGVTASYENGVLVVTLPKTVVQTVVKTVEIV